MRKLAQVNELILSGQYWRLLTSALLHGNVVHLLVNSASLSSLGPLVEKLAGRRRFLAVYLVAAVTSSTASLAASPSIALGASGGRRPVYGTPGGSVASPNPVRALDCMFRQICGRG